MTFIRIIFFASFFLITSSHALIQLSQEEKQWIEKTPIVTFTGDPNWLPYEAFDKEGNYIGIVAQHLQLIEKISGLSFAPIVVSTWSEAKKRAMMGEVQVISGDSADTLLSQKFNGVDPYSHNPIVIIMNLRQNYVENLNQLKRKKIAIMKDYGYTAMIYKKYPTIKFVEVQDIDEGLKAVSSGKYDALLTTMALGSYTIAEMNIHNLKVVGEIGITMKLTFFVSKEQPILQSIINKALKAISTEQKHAILESWIKDKYIERVDYTLLFTITLFLLIIIATILFWMFKLQREVAKRRQLQNKYKAQLELNKLYIDTSEVLLVALDTNANVTMLNKKGKELLGLDDRVIGKNWFDLNVLPKEIEINYRQFFFKVIAQESKLSPKVEHALISKSGEHINFSWRNALLFDKNGQVQGTLSSALDITQKKIQEQIIELRYKLSELSHQRDAQKLTKTSIKTIKLIGKSQEGFFKLINKDFEEEQTFTNRIEPLVDNHASINRLIVPILRGKSIVALIGLSQKSSDYTQTDIKILTQIGDITYDYLERIHAENKVEFMAYYDGLTKLPNRVQLSNKVDEAIKIHLKRGNFFALCFMDLDGFKPVNDQYGHHIGDQLLIELAKRLQFYINKEDIVSRIGGDEFVLVFSNLAHQDAYLPLVKEVLAIVDEPFEIEGVRIHISASIGVTIFPIDTSDTDELLRHADQAMYRAKESGRSKYKLYLKHNTGLQLDKKLFTQFDTALKNNQLTLHYQPKINLSNGKVIGFEALIRWTHPDNGIMFPQEFLFIIKDTPLEFILDEWVITKAFKQKHHFDQTNQDYSISININPRSMHLDSFFEFVSKELSKYPKDFAQGIEFEILEISKIKDTKKVVNTMQRLKNLGISFSLDDFGTGYASLIHFHKLPIDVLKIDQKFIQSMLDDVESLDIIESILNLANKLNRPVVAEGVESLEVAMILHSLGCQFAQGYAISSPLATSRIDQWLEEWNQESIWHQFGVDTSNILVNDIDIVILAHKQWLKDVVNYVKKYPKTHYLPYNQKNCKVTQWYNGIGHAHYGEYEIFSRLKEQHAQVHNSALEIIGALQSNLKESAFAKIKQLNQNSDVLTTLLNELKELK